MTISSSEKPRNGPVTITLDDADQDRIASLASAKKQSPHYLIKEAILEYLQKEEARQNFVAQLMEVCCSESTSALSS